MCRYFSCVVTRDLKVHWSKQSMSHEDLLAALTLEDKKLHERDFVRIEIVPKDEHEMTRNADDWTIKIDEERTLPNWYEKDITKIQTACWKEWQESVNVNLILEGESKEVTDTMIFAFQARSVVARGSSHVEAWDSSHVEAWDSSHVEARDSSHVEARDSSHVEAWDSSHVEARDSSHVVVRSQYASVYSRGKIFVSADAVVVRSSEVKAEEA